MKAPTKLLRTVDTGFTLIEMIGVIAIMSILAAAVAPNALRSIERAAVRAEADTLHNLGEQVKLYLRDTAVAPTSANWNTVFANANYVALSPTDLLYNRRQSQLGPITRIYVPDPVAANQRAMFLSSMRNGIALPSLANISNYFKNIWDTTDGIVPGTQPGLPAAGWGAWNVDNIEYLVIERVNLGTVYRTDLQNYPFTLNNKGTTTVSYEIVPATGPRQWGDIDTTALGKIKSFNLRPRDQLNLYRAAGRVTLDYSYVVSTGGKTFEFKDAVYWTPQ